MTAVRDEGIFGGSDLVLAASLRDARLGTIRDYFFNTSREREELERSL